MTASTITPKKANKRTIPSQVENGARVCTAWRSDSASAMSVHQFERFNQARIAHGEERGFAYNAKINKSEGRADANERDKIPQAQMHAGSVQRRQDDDVHVQHLHEHNPARDITKLVRMFLDRPQK